MQAVAFGGALVFGRLAARYGARDVVLGGLALWLVVIVIGFFLPARQFALWLALAVLIGVVLGGTQALSRSMFSHLVPRGREAEFFSLYQACERGTSLVRHAGVRARAPPPTAYRPAILALVVFFVVGGLLLRTVDVRAGTEQAGNRAPEPAVAAPRPDVRCLTLHTFCTPGRNRRHPPTRWIRRRTC
ncbi:hypothetical protein GCM10025868_45560 [Angustibacter aerolatus]|uniref:Major facilitator superfamily (MFS) profile domain-containing protein n=1 Tax=Angustibacter aerolatus TaxID=1162965 RepID=A0ABQ6JM02_9ACTN|nr:hypothetical protein GCM10025868_45560 [Angustibacter aerolatus]